MPKGMTADKVRNLTEEEMRHQEHDLNEQLFRLKFQMKMGQTESLKKIRGLRKEIARIKTIARERVLGSSNGGSANGGSAKAAVAKAEAPKAAKKSPAPKASTSKKAAEKKTATGRK